MSRPQKKIVRTPPSGDAPAPPQVTGKGRHMKAPEPAADTVPQPVQPTAATQPRPSFTKGRHMTVDLAADDVVVEHHADDSTEPTDPEPQEYVEPYVPSPAVSKYDRRASGAPAEQPPPVDPPVAADPIEPTSESFVAVTDGLTPVSSAEPPPEPEEETKEYVEPYVPAPIWNKYDRRASGAMTKSPRASEDSTEDDADADPADEVETVAAGAAVEEGPEAPHRDEEPQADSPVAAPASAVVEDAVTESITVDLTDGVVEPEPVSSPQSIYDRELRELEEREKAARAEAAAAAAAVDPFADSDGLTYWQRHSARLPRMEDQDD